MTVNTDVDQNRQIITCTQTTPSISTQAALYSQARSHLVLVVGEGCVFLEMLVLSNSPVL